MRRRFISVVAIVLAALGAPWAQAKADTPAIDHQTESLASNDPQALAVTRPVKASADDLWLIYERRDYFDLRDRLPPVNRSESSRIRFLRAATQAAFGDHVAAKRTLRQLLAQKPDGDIENLARRLLMREERADGHYRTALAAIEPLLPADEANDRPQDADLRNVARLLNALRDVAPQKVAQLSGSSAILRDADGRFPVIINGHSMQLGFDTGANFSFLAASVARNAGLTIRPAGVSIASSNGGVVQAEIAVGDLTIGTSRIRNVVFTIYPDAGLTMPDGYFMPGLLGFPVIAALGAIRHSRDGSMQIGVAPPAARRPNMALEGNDVLLRVGYRNEDVLCRLDTGADDTVFYEPFYQRHPELFTDPARKHALMLGGVAGARAIPAYKLASIDLQLAGQPDHLAGPDVMQQSIARNPDDNYLDCNLGLDAFRAFGSYTIDLKTLRLGIQR